MNQYEVKNDASQVFLRKTYIATFSSIYGILLVLSGLFHALDFVRTISHFMKRCIACNGRLIDEEVPSIQFSINLFMNPQNLKQ